MQLQFRTQDGQYIIFDLQFQGFGGDGYQPDSELIAAIVSDSKLSNLDFDSFLDLAGQVIDTSLGHWQGSFVNKWRVLRRLPRSNVGALMNA